MDPISITSFAIGGIGLISIIPKVLRFLKNTAVMVDSKMKIKKLKKNLKKSIKDADYDEFQAACLTIKNYDLLNHTNILEHYKNKLIFTEDQINNRESFLIRFDKSFTYKKFMRIIEHKIEESIRNNGGLDL